MDSPVLKALSAFSKTSYDKRLPCDKTGHMSQFALTSNADFCSFQLAEEMLVYL